MSAEVPAASEQRAAEVLAAHRLTWWAVFPWNGGHEVAPRCTCGVLWAAGDRDDLTTQTARWEAHVAGILADRAAAEDHGLRAAVAAVADWLADKEADMRASYRSGGGQYAEGFRDACDVAETRLRAAIGDDGRGGDRGGS